MSIHDKINKRCTQVQIQKIILDDIMPLLRSNHTFPQISKLLQAKYSKSRSQCDIYITKATELLKVDFNRDIEQKRMEMIESLRADLETSYSMFNETKQVSWMKQIQEIKAKLATYEPNELKPKEEQDNGIIKVVFTEAIENNNE